MLDFKKYILISIICVISIAVFLYVLHVTTNSSGFGGSAGFKDKLLKDYKKQYLPAKYQNRKISDKDIMKNMGKMNGF